MTHLQWRLLKLAALTEDGRNALKMRDGRSICDIEISVGAGFHKSSRRFTFWVLTQRHLYVARHLYGMLQGIYMFYNIALIPISKTYASGGK
jgi:hypothetical protein